MSRTMFAEVFVSPPSPAQGLHVDVTTSAEEVVLRVSGEADLATAPLLLEALEPALAPAASEPLVVLDCKELHFIDAHCLGIIANARSRLHERGRELVLRSPTAFTRRVLGICGMDVLIEL